jgi:hypothetical protein
MLKILGIIALIVIVGLVISALIGHLSTREVDISSILIRRDSTLIVILFPNSHTHPNSIYRIDIIYEDKVVNSRTVRWTSDTLLSPFGYNPITLEISLEPTNPIWLRALEEEEKPLADQKSPKDYVKISITRLES